VKPIAAKNGLDIQLIEFSDYVVPNAALDAGEFQANSFQNQPYLDNQKVDRGYKIESVGLTVNFPIGVYSKKHKSWSDIPNGGTVSIPNDPTNGGRVLLLLRDKEVIKLKEGVGFKPKPSHHLQSQEAEIH
jgi:D-methionine transport system substrate-binding protein